MIPGTPSHSRVSLLFLLDAFQYSDAEQPTAGSSSGRPRGPFMWFNVRGFPYSGCWELEVGGWDTLQRLRQHHRFAPTPTLRKSACGLRFTSSPFHHPLYSLFIWQSSETNSRVCFVGGNRHSSPLKNLGWSNTGKTYLYVLS